MGLNKKLMQEWVDALRSGRYEQGHKVLSNRDGEFCCLGVLCDIQGMSHPPTAVMPPLEAVQALGKGWIKLPEGMGWSQGLGSVEVRKDTVVSLFPEKAEPIGLKEKRSPDRIGVQHLNDRGFTFAQIADCLEKEYL